MSANLASLEVFPLSTEGHLLARSSNVFSLCVCTCTETPGVALYILIPCCDKDSCQIGLELIQLSHILLTPSLKATSPGTVAFWGGKCWGFNRWWGVCNQMASWVRMSKNYIWNKWDKCGYLGGEGKGGDTFNLQVSQLFIILTRLHDWQMFSLFRRQKQIIPGKRCAYQAWLGKWL